VLWGTECLATGVLTGWYMSGSYCPHFKWWKCSKCLCLHEEGGVAGAGRSGAKGEPGGGMGRGRQNQPHQLPHCIRIMIF